MPAAGVILCKPGQELLRCGRRGYKLSILLRLAAKSWRGGVEAFTRKGEETARRSATPTVA
jgi:hypothetical protein